MEEHRRKDASGEEEMIFVYLTTPIEIKNLIKDFPSSYFILLILRSLNASMY